MVGSTRGRGGSGEEERQFCRGFVFVWQKIIIFVQVGRCFGGGGGVGGYGDWGFEIVVDGQSGGRLKEKKDGIERER